MEIFNGLLTVAKGRSIILSAETVSSFPDFYLPPDYATARPPSQPVKVMLNMGISEIINVNDKKNVKKAKVILDHSKTPQAASRVGTSARR